jgi:uncharacterized repeat protein (TIGR01451 family)
MNMGISIHAFKTALLSVVFLGVFLDILPISASASTIYGVDDKQAVYSIDSDTSVATEIYAGQNKGSYTIAHCPDGMLYFTDIFAGANPINLYRFNPATPATPPVSLGTLPEMTRAACHPTTGMLYFMRGSPNDIYQVVPGPSSFTMTQTTLTLPATTPPGIGGGDIAFHPNGTLYLLDTVGNYAPPTRLWIINLSTNQIENVGAVTGLPGISLVHGFAFDTSGNIRIAFDSNDPVRVLYTMPIGGGAVTPIASGNPLGVYMKDLASHVAPPAQTLITLVKASSVFSDPVNGTTTPKRISGAVITYSIVTTNSGQGSVDNNEIILTDPIPADTDFIVNDFEGAGSGPIAFINGSPSSGLTYTLSNATFFSDTACTNAIPLGIPDINGVNATIRCIRVNPQGVFVADDATPPSPNFTISFRARIR